MSEKAIKSFTVHRARADSEAAKRLRRAGRDPRIVDEAPRTEDWRDGKGQLYLAPRKAETMRYCASMHPEYICCSVRVLDSVSNCPFDCTYCFLQSYLTDTTMQVVVDADALAREVRKQAACEPGRFFRVGTWELGDSLALDPLTGTAADLVRAFASMDNAVLELKTKSNHVGGLLALEHGGRTVVGWTLSPQTVVRSEELGTASARQRLVAMANVARAGYPVSVHFDPIIIHDGWQAAYEDLVARLFDAVPARSIAWISLGALRFNPEMKKLIVANYPRSKITTPEMVLGNDGKVRYVKPLRLKLYHRIVEALRPHLGEDGPLVYLCMERWDVWRRVFGDYPRSSAELDHRFAESLHRRFPGLVRDEPDRAHYEPEDDDR